MSKQMRTERSLPLWPALALAALAAVALPNPALAGTVQMANPTTNADAPGGVVYLGDAGPNRIGIAETQAGGGQVYAVRDLNTGAPFAASAPCAVIAGPNTAACPRVFGGQLVRSYQVLLGGGNDRFVPGDGFGGTRAEQQGAFTHGAAYGGVGNDTLISEWATRDRFFGGSGDDFLFVNNGVGNELNGGSGNDRISSSGNGRRDFITCGPGDNDRATVDLPDTVRDPANCGVIERAPKDQHPVVKILGHRVLGGSAVRLRCPRKAKRNCRGVLTLARIAGKRRGRLRQVRLGSARYRIRRGKRTTVRVPVSGRTGRRVLATARERDSRGRPKISTAQLRG